MAIPGGAWFNAGTDFVRLLNDKVAESPEAELPADAVEDYTCLLKGVQFTNDLLRDNHQLHKWGVKFVEFKGAVIEEGILSGSKVLLHSAFFDPKICQEFFGAGVQRHYVWLNMLLSAIQSWYWFQKLPAPVRLHYNFQIQLLCANPHAGRG